MKDITGREIQLGDMLTFNEDKYNQVLGIVKYFSIVNNDAVFVTVCGGGGITGNRMITASKAEIVTSLEDE